MDLGLESLNLPKIEKEEKVSVEELQRQGLENDLALEQGDREIDDLFRLYDVALHVEENGISEETQKLFDENEQLSNYLGTEFKSGNEKAVLESFEQKFDAIHEQSEASTEDSKSTMIAGWITVLIGGIVYGFAATPIGMLIGAAILWTATGLFIATMVQQVKEMEEEAEKLPDGKDDEGSKESLFDKAKVPEAKEFMDHLKNVRKAVNGVGSNNKGIINIIEDSSKEKTDDFPVSDAVKLAESIGYKQKKATKFEKKDDLDTKKDTLINLGWKIKDIKKLVEEMSSDKEMLEASKDQLEKANEKAESEVDKFKKDLKKKKEESDEKPSKEDKKKAKAKIDELREKAKVIKAASEAILGEYEKMVKILVVVVKTAAK